MAAHKYVSVDQFKEHMLDKFGDLGQAYVKEVPRHVYRGMSDYEYQKGMEQGFFKSNEENNWRGQAQRSGDPNWEKQPQEGTVGTPDATLAMNYLPRNVAGRVVKFDATKHPEWEMHPYVPDGDYIRTLGKIPADSIVAATDPVEIKE